MAFPAAKPKRGKRMFGIGSTELLVILVVALIVLGPKSLPGIAKTIGKAMGEFRRVSTEFQRTMNVEMEQEEHEKRKKEAEQELFGDKAQANKQPQASQTAPTAQAQQPPTADQPKAEAASTTVDAATGTSATPHTLTASATVADVAAPVAAPDSPLGKAIAKAEAEAQSETVGAGPEAATTSTASTLGGGASAVPSKEKA